jgi:myosin heavy subunit
VRTGASQSILVSGESGAGKTEACKLVVACLTTLAPAGVAGATEAALHGSQMLEAWGNATTTNNRNSSRFGKWLTVHFDATSGAISQCSLSPYLLEKSRVVVHAKGERSYHVFYQMVAGVRGAERRERLGLGPADGTCLYSRYAYLKPQGTTAEGRGAASTSSSAGPPPPPPALDLEAEGVSASPVEGLSALEEEGSASWEEDASEWRETLLQLSGIGLAPPLTESVTSSLAAVLALGNVAFHAPTPSAGYWGSPPQSPRGAAAGSSALRVHLTPSNLITPAIDS